MQMKPVSLFWCFAALGMVVDGADAACEYGPDTCKPGYVWREAFPGDHVCVTGATRAQAAADNALASQRRSPTGGPYGPDTCLPGFVWREASPSDHVCVTGEVRAQTAADNAQADARRDLQCAAMLDQGAANLLTMPGWNADGDLIVEVVNRSKLPGSIDTLTGRLPGAPARPCEWVVNQRLEVPPTARKVVVVADRAAVEACMGPAVLVPPDRFREIRFSRPQAPAASASPQPAAQALTIEIESRTGGQTTKATSSWSLTHRVQ